MQNGGGAGFFHWQKKSLDNVNKIYDLLQAFGISSNNCFKRE